MKLRLGVWACVLLFALMLPIAAQAQSNAPEILPSGCGTASFPNNSGYLTIDSSGKLCATVVGAATSANQTNGTQQAKVVDGSGNVLNAALTPTVSAAAENSHVIKASAGQVQGCYAVNLTTTPGFLVLLNLTSAPSDGAITPLAVAPLPANGSASIGGAQLNPLTFGTGITAVLTSATTPFTKTTGVITGFISCQAI